MNLKAIARNKLQVTLAALLLTLAFLLWEHFNGGVVTHHLLARKDLPGISNWWGLLTIPMLTWLMMSLIDKRRAKFLESNTDTEGFDDQVIKHFLAALAFGVVASLLWEFRLVEVLPFYILSPVVIALFKPVHYPEYILGFVVGMLFTFGGILPIIVATVLFALCFLVNRLAGLIKNLI